MHILMRHVAVFASTLSFFALAFTVLLPDQPSDQPSPAAWVIDYSGDVQVQRSGESMWKAIGPGDLELYEGDVLETRSESYARILMRNGVELHKGENEREPIRTTVEGGASMRAGFSDLVAWLFDREPADAPGWSRSPAEPEPAVLVTPREGFIVSEIPMISWVHAIPAPNAYTLRLRRDETFNACSGDGAIAWTKTIADTTATLPPLDDLKSGASYRIELADPSGALHDYGCFVVADAEKQGRIAALLADIETSYGQVGTDVTATLVFAGLLAKEEHFPDAIQLLHELPSPDRERPAVRRLESYIFGEIGPALMIHAEP